MPVWRDEITGKWRFSTILAIIHLTVILLANASAGTAIYYGMKYTLDRHEKEISKLKEDAQCVKNTVTNHLMGYSGDQVTIDVMQKDIQDIKGYLGTLLNQTRRIEGDQERRRKLEKPSYDARRLDKTPNY